MSCSTALPSPTSTRWTTPFACPLSAFPALGAVGGLQASAFFIAAGGQATLASQRIVYDPTTGIVRYDINGFAFAVNTLIVGLENLPANVTAADCVIIA